MASAHDNEGGMRSSAPSGLLDTPVLRGSEFASAWARRDEDPEDEFIQEHGLALAVEATERLARDQFGPAFHDLERTVRIDGDLGTEYLHISVLIASGVEALLDAEPDFFAALAACVPDVDWSSILVSLTPCP